MRFTKYLAAIVLSLLVAACNPFFSFQVYKNENIDQSVSNEIHALNDKLLSHLRAGDRSALEPMLCDELRQKHKEQLTKLLPTIKQALNGRQPSRLDEYYAITGKDVSPIHIEGGSGDNAYVFNVNSLTKKTYISLVLVSDSNLSGLFTFIYGNYNGKWLLDIIHMDDYSLYNKTAPVLYREAQRLEQNGALLDAFNRLSVASLLALPEDPYMKYKLGDSISLYQKTLYHEAGLQYKFPIPLTFLKSNPVIYNIRYQTIGYDNIPLITYKSNIDINDTTHLKQENLEIHKRIGSIFHGLTRNNKAILYYAYNKIPQGNRSERYYWMRQPVTAE